MRENLQHLWLLTPRKRGLIPITWCRMESAVTSSQGSLILIPFCQLGWMLWSTIGLLLQKLTNSRAFRKYGLQSKPKSWWSESRIEAIWFRTSPAELSVTATYQWLGYQPLLPLPLPVAASKNKAEGCTNQGISKVSPPGAWDVSPPQQRSLWYWIHPSKIIQSMGKSTWNHG